MDGLGLLRRSVRKLRKSGHFFLIWDLLRPLGLDNNRFSSIEENSPEELYTDLFQELTKIGSDKIIEELRRWKTNRFLWDMFVTEKDELLMEDLIGLIQLWEKESKP